MKRENGIYHKTFYCSDFNSCSDGDKVFDIFLVSDIRYHSNDHGVTWRNVRLEDKSGSIRAKIWANRMEPVYDTYKDQIALVSGRIGFYAGKPDFSIDKMQLLKESEFELSEIISMLSEEKCAIYKSSILSLIDKISTASIREFVSYQLNHDVLQQMAEIPLHLYRHHTYRGAMLEHVCEVATSAYYYAKSTYAFREQKYDIDLILAGALLHDIGMLAVFAKNGYGFSVAKSDRMLGDAYTTHMLLYEARFECEGSNIIIDDLTFGLLMHIIDASHGKAEPATMEAMIVKSMNELSAEKEMYENSYISSDMYQQDSDFIWSKNLKREISRVRREDVDGK